MNTIAATANLIARAATRALPGLALLVAGLLMLPAVPRAFAGTLLSSITAKPDSGITVRVEQLFKDLPPMGYAPLRVYIKNKSAYQQSWQITTTHSPNTFGTDGRSLRASQTLTVDAGREGDFLILAPLLPRADAGQIYYASNPNLRITMSGYGMDETSDNFNNKGRPLSPTSSGGNRRNELPFIAVSEKFVQKGWLEIATGQPSLDGTSVDAADWPADYRAYLGVYAAFIAREDWQSMRPEQRQAIQQWVIQGGHLYICWPEASESGLAGIVSNRTAQGTWGAGSIRAMVVKDTLAGDKVRKCLQPAQDPRYWGQERVVTNNSSSSGDDEDKTISRDVSMMVKFGAGEGLNAPEIPRGLILLFVLGFSILVGPINLFYLAPVSKRYRLFWTTPLISVMASLFLMALIFLSEGIGGSGNRVLATLLMPDDRKSVVIQEQASRTAVLFYPSFTLPQGTLQPVRFNTGDDDGNSYPSRGGRSQQSSDRAFYLKNTGNTTLYSGAWFTGRALQAEWLQIMEDTRAQITLTNPAETGSQAPVLLSQVDSTLEKVFYRDRDGKVWTCDNLGRGQKLACKPASEQVLKEYLSKAKDKFGRRLKALYADTEGNRGWFYANAGEGHENAIETLSGIRWTSLGHYFLGPVSGGAPLPVTSTSASTLEAGTPPSTTTTSGSSGVPGSGGAQQGTKP